MENKTNTSQHPVWDVYDEFRTARLNLKLANYKLIKLKRINTCIEVLIAVTASSGIAGLWFWQNVIGGYIWKILGAITAFISVLKPFLNLSNKIQEKCELLTDIQSLEHDFHLLTISINQTKNYDDKLKKQFFALLEKKGTIKRKSKEEHTNANLKRKYEEEVIKELPTEHFYVPEE